MAVPPLASLRVLRSLRVGGQRRPLPGRGVELEQRGGVVEVAGAVELE